MALNAARSIAPGLEERRKSVLIAAAGRYRALKKIADGGSADIYLAEHVGSVGYRRLVALKCLKPGLPAHLQRLLLEEAHVTMGLSHGNLVEVRDVGEIHGRQFLVLELVDGWTVEQLLVRARETGVALPPRVALHIAAEVCRALGYVHDRGIVHCDICPHNVLVSETGEVKLTDFGIARMPSRPVLPGVVAGKPMFMSPEQAAGDALDNRSDLFSLGSVLYYLLTDARPFKPGDDIELMERVARGEFVSPMKRRPSLPKELGQLLLSAMRPQPWARYQTAHEMLQAIEVVMRAHSRSELERWLGALHEKDKVLPPTREKSATVVPLRAARTAATKRPAAPRPKKKWAMAGLAVLVLAFGADRAWSRVSSVAPEPVPAPVVEREPSAAAAGEALKHVPFEATVEVSIDEDSPEPVVVVDAEPLRVAVRVVRIADQDRAIVSVDTEPTGAEVMVDDRLLGVTPVALRFRTGIPFAVTFMREGSGPVVKWLTVERPQGGAARAVLSEPK